MSFCLGQHHHTVLPYARLDGYVRFSPGIRGLRIWTARCLNFLPRHILVSLCLTLNELHELTGKRTRPAMARVLRQMGLEFRIGGDGWPRVDREHYAKIMSGAAARRTRRAEPRYEAVKRARV